MNTSPYCKAVVVAVRLASILYFTWMLLVVIVAFCQASLSSFGVDPVRFLISIAGPVALYFLAKPIAWLATLGIK